MSNLAKIKSIYSQKLPGKLLKKHFSHAIRDTSRRNNRKGLVAFYHLSPNLGIFESQEFLHFNKTRYSPRHRCDKIIRDIMLAPAAGERLNDVEIRKSRWVTMKPSGGRREPVVLKRNTAYSGDRDRTSAGEDRDVVLVYAKVSPFERPETQRHKRFFSYISAFDHGVRDMFSKIRLGR